MGEEHGQVARREPDAHQVPHAVGGARQGAGRGVRQLTGVPGVQDLYVDPITGGKYLQIDLRRDQLARYGLSVDQVNEVVETAIGGAPVATTVEGRRRFSINVRLSEVDGEEFVTIEGAGS